MVVQGKVPTDLSGLYLRNGPNPGSHRSAATRTRSTATGWCTGCGSRTAPFATATGSSRPPACGPRRAPSARCGPGLMTFDPPGADLVGAELAGTVQGPARHQRRAPRRALAGAGGGRPPVRAERRAGDRRSVVVRRRPPEGDVRPPQGRPGDRRARRVPLRLRRALPDLGRRREGRVDGAPGDVDPDRRHLHDPRLRHHRRSPRVVRLPVPLRHRRGDAWRAGAVVEPDLGTRIAVVPRDGSAGHAGSTPIRSGSGTSPTRSRRRRPCSIVVDFCRWDEPGLGSSSVAPTGAVERATLDMVNGTVDIAPSTMASPSSPGSMIGCSADVIATSTPPAATATTCRRSPGRGTRSSGST